MDRRHDPRTIVTPYAFSVHPDLLGRPLATPWQRLGAITIDGVVILGLTRIGGLTLAIASTLLLFWLAFRKPSRDVFGKLFRVAVGCLGTLVLAITVNIMVGVQLAQRIQEDPGTRAALQEALKEAGVQMQTGVAGDSLALGRILEVAPNALDLRTAETPEEALPLMQEIGETARESGMALEDIRSILEALAPSGSSWAQAPGDLVNEVMASLRTGLPRAEAGAPSDSTQAATAITDSLALDSIRALNGLVQDLDEGRRDLETQLRRTEARLAEEEREAESSGPLSWLFNLIDDLGLGFGWGALYLTITHAWWKGTSIGKKLFRIRVVMIDKRPLNWWLSFERAGGYAAGVATGLLGFAQIFWDPNRQAIHDKVSETIVIQDGKAPIPGPWMEEGKGLWKENQSSARGPGVQK